MHASVLVMELQLNVNTRSSVIPEKGIYLAKLQSLFEGHN